MSRFKDLIRGVREKAYVNRNGIFRPRTEGEVKANWPVCQTCKRSVEAVELKNQNSFGVEIWARCHGKEDFYTLKYPYRIEDSDSEEANDQVKVALRAFNPFVPEIS